jgi:hypothetical protein
VSLVVATCLAALYALGFGLVLPALEQPSRTTAGEHEHRWGLTDLDHPREIPTAPTVSES